MEYPFAGVIVGLIVFVLALFGETANREAMRTQGRLMPKRMARAYTSPKAGRVAKLTAMGLGAFIFIASIIRLLSP